MLDVSRLFDSKKRPLTYREIKFEAINRGLCNERSVERTVSQLIKRGEVTVHEEEILGKTIKFYELII